MSPWKYVFDEKMDIINNGIPFHLYKGKIVKDVHVPYMLKKYPERLMECDESGELLATKSLREAVAPPAPPEPVKSEPKMVEAPKEPEAKEPEPVAPKEPEKKVKELPKAPEKSKKEEKSLDPAIASIKSSSQLKSMFKEDLEELCKKLGINEVGSKGALIKKISAVLNIK